MKVNFRQIVLNDMLQDGKSCNLAPELVDGIVFAIIHYNRSICLRKSLESIRGELRPGDCLFLIDNGSSQPVQKEIIQIFKEEAVWHGSHICMFCASTPVNQGGIPAYEYLIETLLGETFPGASHFLILGDDDFLMPGWREEIQPYISRNNWISWGYNYYHWKTHVVEKICEHSGLVAATSGDEEYAIWLKRISGRFQHYAKQEHSSAVAVSLRSLRKAARILPTLVPLPYADVGLALISAYASKIVYIHKPLSMIGRGFNYGMGDSATMANNHPTRFPIRGMPSHSKYLAATYCECLLMTENYDLIISSVTRLFIRHFAINYVLALPAAIKSITFPRVAYSVASARMMLQDLGFLLVIMLSVVAPKYSLNVTFYLLGFTSRICSKSLSEIRRDLILAIRQST